MLYIDYIGGDKGRDGDYEITMLYGKDLYYKQHKVILSGFSYEDMVERIDSISKGNDPEYRLKNHE